MDMTEDAKDFILERSIPIPEAGCWLWLKAISATGYGHTAWHGLTIKAHRLSYMAFVGPIPDGMLVQHSCDNRWCVSPMHLSLGTDVTNSMDKQRKGRAAKTLTADDIAAIRASREDSRPSDEKLSDYDRRLTDDELTQLAGTHVPYFDAQVCSLIREVRAHRAARLSESERQTLRELHADLAMYARQRAYDEQGGIARQRELLTRLLARDGGG